MPDDGSVRFDNLTNSIGVLVLVGPRARDILQKVTRTDLGNKAFPWLSSRLIDVNMAPTMAFRMNYVGELGWELHHPIEYQNHIFDALMEAGAAFQLKPFGIRAMDAMRLEKSYRMVGTELSIEYAALESGLDRFVHLNKGDFIGRQKLSEWQERGFANAMVTIEVHDTTDADAIGGNPIMLPDGEVVGRATSGGYGFRVDKSLAMAMVRPDLATVGTKLMIDILDQRLAATVIEESPYDPTNEKLRA
jgi:dimethylglycine dehydrogenase